MSQTLLLRILLVCTLLFAQQGAMSHGISHSLAEQTHEQSIPHDEQCELCAAYAQIGNAVGSSGLHFDGDVTAHSVEPAYSPSFHSHLFAAFAARAPPHSA